MHQLDLATEVLTIQTKVAIYVVSFNYTLEKVIGFTRIPLQSITSIQKGPYILSPLQEAGRDPVEVGLESRPNVSLTQAEFRIRAQLLAGERADEV